ncbi:hypothetical protein ACVWY2_007776 [Bradyrhizobium sp. JR6.1]
MNSARFITARPPGTRRKKKKNPRDRECRGGGDEQRQRADGERDHGRIPELDPEVAQEVMLLVEHDREIMQRRMRRPQLAGERVLLRRDREYEHVVDRDHGPDEDRDADQQQLGFGADFAEGGQLHRDNRFIM